MNIPKIFYQAWEGSLPYIIHQKNISHLPKDIEYKLFSLNDMREYLYKNWGKEYLDLFNNYDRIAHKTDLWRYCILYDTGGMYMDADCVLLNDISFMFEHDLLFVTNNRGIKNIFNGFLMTPPKNPIFKEIINKMLIVGNNFNNDYYFNCSLLYRIVNKYINKADNDFVINIEDKTYKTLILLDMNVFKVSLVKNQWYEYNRFCACYKNIPILIEENKYYPYKKTYTKPLH